MEEKLISHALVDSVSLPTFPEGTLEGKIVGIGSVYYLYPPDQNPEFASNIWYAGMNNYHI